ncbi:hypothetical protein SAMN04488498_13918 [Mesorhizobium albiziae]|uniref:Uncharacterized protein n=1 Tax=Neomesorhizobium albiziae TaxID=335020 RepID=A0A1I4F8E6_9HYPH|nr:hypothetical protein GCM10007937_24230 [Mesorhizobium albiziae]SFL14252.1 hypothetical protein SAMN04488498_13918 [Mesorhizobium albiziae]
MVRFSMSLEAQVYSKPCARKGSRCEIASLIRGTSTFRLKFFKGLTPYEFICSVAQSRTLQITFDSAMRD